jgi:phospholipid/cholesterol/gamma-HCH transport system permease protein
MSVEVRRTAAGLTLALTGEWSAGQFAELDLELTRIELAGAGAVTIDARQLATLDLSGAYALRRFLARSRAEGVAVSFIGPAPPQLALLDRTLAPGSPGDAGTAGTAPATAAASAGTAAALEADADRFLAFVGREAVQAGRDLFSGLAFQGHTLLTLLGCFTSLKRLRPISVARHVYDTGITAMPIVALIAFLISVIIAYLSAQQLGGLGVDIYVVDLVTIGVLRELGVLLTSIIVAGRSGSAYAAELGSMKLNEEVDALIATGVDPFEVLVLPRILGLMIALPLLTIVADLIGMAGGALLCRFLLDMPLTQYVTRANLAISPTTFWVGLIKAPVFALLIAGAGCYRGMQVRGSARELGRLVTVAVVQAIFFVILADAFFAVLFMKLNI